MPGNIFISYRRSENPKDARALYERLRREFGELHVFIDLEGIEPGEDFVETIERQLQDCQVLVALIGRDWTEAKNERGERRLDDENDFVRIELRTALKRGIRVIPVLIDGCPPPDARRLPEDLQPLVRRHAVSLDFNRFDTDAGRLAAAIRRVLEGQQPVALAAQMSPPRPQPLPPPAVPPPTPKREPPPPTAPPTTSPSALSQHPGMWLAIAAAVLVVLGVSWSLLSGPRQATSAEPFAGNPVVFAASAAVPGQSPPKRFRDCDDPACPWLVTIDKGSFTMGSPAGEVGRDADEGPQHTVRIGYRLAVMETEVTRGQFWAFVEATKHDMTGPCRALGKDGKWGLQADRNWLNTGFEQTDEHPVVCVSWNDGQAYAQWLGRKTGQRYRLLSEAEWEFAARAGTTTRFSFGDDDSRLCAYANVADRAAGAKWSSSWTTADCDDGAAYTASVRRYQPNAWGLYDMHGNAREWVQDCKGSSADYAGAPADGSSVGKPDCTLRLLRGGAWFDDPRYARSANRGGSDPAHRNSNTGLRLTRMLP